MAVALLVAAGSGERLGADRPKAFVVLAGRPLFEWSLDAIREADVREIVIALPPGDLDDDLQGLERCTVVAGGTTRSQSVRNALRAATRDQHVLVHDAARPLAQPELFERCLAGLADADAAIAATRVTDTIKEAREDLRVERTLDRSRLWAIQTPQAFRRDALERALDVPDDVLAQATDDAWLVERSGGVVAIVEAPPSNLKVTTPSDLQVAELLLRQRSD